MWNDNATCSWLYSPMTRAKLTWYLSKFNVTTNTIKTIKEDIPQKQMQAKQILFGNLLNKGKLTVQKWGRDQNQESVQLSKPVQNGQSQIQNQDKVQKTDKKHSFSLPVNHLSSRYKMHPAFTVSKRNIWYILGVRSRLSCTSREVAQAESEIVL